jgi:hypothetical protein
MRESHRILHNPSKTPAKLCDDTRKPMISITKNRLRQEKETPQTCYVQSTITKRYRFGLFGGLFAEGIGGASLPSGCGASSLVSVALRIAFLNLDPKFGTVDWCPCPMPCTLWRWLPWKLLRLCADSMRVSIAADVNSLEASKLGRTRSIDMRARSKLGRTRYSVELRVMAGRPSMERRVV